MALSSLINGGFAGSVPTISILIWNLVNGGNSLELKTYSLNSFPIEGFTLSSDELARSSQVMGATNTLPLDLRGLTTTVTTPIIYALGTITTAVSFFVIGLSLGLVFLFNRRKF